MEILIRALPPKPTWGVGLSVTIFSSSSLEEKDFHYYP